MKNYFVIYDLDSGDYWCDSATRLDAYWSNHAIEAIGFHTKDSAIEFIKTEDPYNFKGRMLEIKEVIEL